jgi:CubicO group peptidase (beta-lactamase class C family)
MEQIAKRIGQLMEEQQVPAVQVGVIRGKETLFLGGGYRDMDRQLKADEHTTFAIGSQTKSFITTALTLLAEEGRIGLDKPVREYIPEFAMEDSGITDTLTVRDILSHRSGLARHEFMQQLNIDSFSAEEYVRKFRYLKAGAPIRSKMLYSNLMYLLAGYLIERVTSEKWSDFIRDRLLSPIGMNETNCSVAENSKVENRALPYCLSGGKVTEMPSEDIKAAGPAGSMNSTSADMLKWLRFHLDKGRCGERAIVSAAGIEQCHTPHTIMTDRSPLFKGEMQFQAYGLGWFTECYRGHWIVRHAGGIDGFIAEMDIIPELDAGFFICSNLDANFVPGMLQFYLYDTLLGLSEIDWRQRFGDMHAMMQGRFSQHVKTFQTLENAPGLPLAQYAGVYENPAYGKIYIQLEDGELVFRARKLKVPLRHLGYNAFLMLQEDRFLAIPLQFMLDLQGRVTSVEIDFEPMVGMIRYGRVNEAPDV